MGIASNHNLGSLLKQVSRSFYLTLRVLPASIRTQIGLAYLLARTTDTIADTDLVPLDGRLQALQDLRNRLLGQSDGPLELREMATRQAAVAERTLLEECETSLALLQRLAPPDLKLVREVLDTITGGQELELRRFAGASSTNVRPLKTEE